MAITVRAGNQTVSVDPALERFLAKVIAKVAPVTKSALERAGDEVETSAAEGSPVKTGKFRDSWIHGIRIVRADIIEGYVANTDPKARFVRRPWPSRTFVFRPLLFGPGRKKAQELARKLAPELIAKV